MDEKLNAMTHSILLYLIEKTKETSEPLTIWLLTSGGLIIGTVVTPSELIEVGATYAGESPGDYANQIPPDPLTQDNTDRYVLLRDVRIVVGAAPVFQTHLAHVRLQDVSAWYIGIPLPVFQD